jgi:serine/threonine protein kinase
MPDLAPSEKSIFLQAIEMESVAEREAYLDQACEGNQPLRAEVEALLRAHEAPQRVLDAPVGGTPTTDQAPLSEKPGTTIGPYKLLQQVGEGGMGVVYMAEQQEPVRRKVALKIIKPGMDSRQVIARFEAERQALALMDHQNIARVLDGGATASGRPYFVMELVKGVPVTRFCDEQHLTPRERLELFVPVCQAIQHAHQKGIIHRDVKPSNILVTLYDGRPVPKVIDFGVAKAIEQRLTERTLFTQLGQVVGTVEYMSPEQAELNALDIDTRSDIYSLGVLLYELLTGSTPLEKQKLRGAAFGEMLRMIREEEPPRPSTRLSASGDQLPTISAQRKTEPARLAKLVRGELDWIVMKALEKDRSRRYETANGFARDIERYLAGEAVLAAPPGARYRLGKFLRRHSGPVLAAGTVLLALVVGIVGTALGLVRAEQALAAEAAQRGIAEASERDAQAQKGEAQAQKQRAFEFRDKALDALRAATSKDVEKLLGNKSELGPNERAYLEAIAKRWQAFADQEGDDEQAQAFRGEGHWQVALLWDKLGRRQDAVAEYEKAEATFTKLADQFPDSAPYQRTLAATLNNLAARLRELGHLEAALTKHLRARDVQTKLVKQYPAVAVYQQELAGTYNNVGILYTLRHNFDAARTEYESARKIRADLGERFPKAPEFQRDLAYSHYNTALLLERMGNLDEAKVECESALRLRTQLAKDFPEDPSYRFYQAITHNSLGRLLANFGGRSTAADRDKARAEFLRAIDLQQELAGQFPALPNYRQGLADARQNMGQLLVSLENLDEAQQHYEQARRDYEWLVKQFPNSPDYQGTLAHSHDRCGDLFRRRGKLEEACAEYQRAVELWTGLAKRYPDAPDYQLHLGGECCNLGGFLVDAGKSAESVEWFDRAIEALTALLGTPSHDAKATPWLRNSYGNRALALVQLRRYAAAVKDYDRAVDLSARPEQGNYRALRATARLRAGQVAEAVAEVAVLTAPGAGAPEAAGWTAEQWYGFACVYAAAGGQTADKKQEYADRAMELLLNAVQAGYKDAAQLAQDADLGPLRDREDFQKLLAKLQGGQEKPRE